MKIKKTKDSKKVDAPKGYHWMTEKGRHFLMEGNYTQPGMRKRIFSRIKSGSKGGNPGQWSARKAQMLAKAYKAAGGGYKN